MPSLDNYRKMLGNKTLGQARKDVSDMIMDATFDGDINTRVCYFYDYWHDNCKTRLKDLHPEKDPDKVAIIVKWRRSSAQTYDKDIVTHHIQFKTSQKMNVDYYPEYFENRYNAIFPVGLYIDIPDEKGIYNRWLVVGTANYFVSQFPTFEVLPCDKILDWVWNGKKIRMAGCLRSQNSYNSGVWTDYKITYIEDQQKFLVPANSLSEKLYYNQRMIIDNKVDVLNGAEPRTWKISKINRINSNGIILATLAQDLFDQHKDYIEYEDENDPSSIQGMYADYYSDGVLPSDYQEKTPKYRLEISYPGKPEMKINGNYKKFTLTFYKDDEYIDYFTGTWSFKVNDTDVSSLIDSTIDECDENQLRIKFIGNDEYIGETLHISYTSYNGITGSVNIILVGV